MCVRYTLSASDKELLKEYPQKLVGDWEPHFNLAPTLEGLVITSDEPDIIQHMRFGIVPYWATSMKLTYDTWNIRSEDVLTSKMYGPLIRNHKTCVIIADGFYEWFGPKNDKQPWYFKVKKRKRFMFAGLWSEWKDPETEESHRTYGIMTTVANNIVGEIHEKKRMPVILPLNREKMWLNKDLSPTQLLTLCVPYPDELMTRTRVSKRINSVHRRDKPNNDGGLTLPLNTDEDF